MIVDRDGYDEVHLIFNILIKRNPSKGEKYKLILKFLLEFKEINPSLFTRN
jgi:hypothetical protein